MYASVVWLHTRSSYNITDTSGYAYPSGETWINQTGRQFFLKKKFHKTVPQVLKEKRH